MKSPVMTIAHRYCLIVSMLCLSGCSQEAVTKSTYGDKEKRLEQSQIDYANIVESERTKQLAKSGNTILNVPPRKTFDVSSLRSQSGSVCYNIETPPRPWFIVDIERHSKQWDTKTGYDLVLAAASTDLNMPFFEVKVDPPVTYEFVTPYQEYFYVMISAVSLEFKASSFAENINFHTKAFDGYYKPFEFNIRNYSDWSFETFSSNGFNNLIGIDEQSIASLKYEDDITIVNQDVITILNSPTAQFYSSPHAVGQFLHKSGKVTVKIKFSAKAIPDAARLFDYAHEIVSEIIVSCEAQ